MAYTYTECDIVINQVRITAATQVYVQDFSYATKTDTVLPYWVTQILDPKHVRKFESMNEFTLFLLEYKVVVDKCLVTINDYA